MSWNQALPALLASLLPLAVQADWSPQWRSQWQPDLAEPRVFVFNVRTDADGNAFVAASARARLDPFDHLATLRFGADGGLAWATIDPAWTENIAPLVVLSDGRIATVVRTNDGTDFQSLLQVRDPATGALLIDERMVVHQTS